VAAFLVISLLCAVNVVSWAGKTWTVCSSGCNFRSIQAAVNVASSGDTISIGKGRYCENVSISHKDLTIVGGGKYVTSIVAADRSKPVISIVWGDVSICNLSIMEGTRGIDMWFASASLYRCGIVRNVREGVYDLRNYKLKLTECQVIENGGDGVLVENSQPNFELEVTRSIIKGNGGAGLRVVSSDRGFSGVVSGNTIIANQQEGAFADATSPLDGHWNYMSENRIDLGGPGAQSIGLYGPSMRGFGRDENGAVINGYPVITADPATASDWYDTEVMYNLYSPLVYPSPEGGVRAHLATSWEAVGYDLTHWRFTLRRGVKFHSGYELTAEDVAFSMTRFITMGRGNSGPLGQVTATVVDKYTVDFLLDKPSAIFPETLALFFVVEKNSVLANIKEPGNYGDFGDYGEDWLATHDAGTGPYMMINHIPGQGLYATRFLDYFEGWSDEGWGADEVPIEQLMFIMETDYTTLMTLLKSGDLDLEINGGWTLPQLQEIQADPNFGLTSVWAQNVTVWMNTQVPPTDDEHFRKAILYAFDYESVVGPWGALGNGETGILLPNMPGYVPIEPQPRAQNLERARQELVLSKYADSLDDVTVVFHFCGGFDFEEDIGLQLQADMAQLGVNVEVAGPPWPEYSAEFETPETTPNMTIFVFAPDFAPPLDYYTYSMFHPNGLGWIFAAHWYFDDFWIIDLLDATREEGDLWRRLALYEEVQFLIASHGLALYPYQKPVLFAHQAYIVGPKETIVFVGPSENLHNWRINLKLKEELRE